MKKVFLAGPFKALVNEQTGELCSYMKTHLSGIISQLSDLGMDVHNAHQREGWGKEFMTPEECTEIDYREIAACDYFIAFPGAPASPGTHIEIGWASALGKKIILLLENEKTYAFLIRGLHTVGNVDYINFDYKDSNLTYMNTLIEKLELTHAVS